MRVIDGMHRLAAAVAKGQEVIDVNFFDGTPDEAFLCSVEANVTHGLPLSQTDRRAAAMRIVSTHPHMSDRAIARASGLGAKTVAAIRDHSSDVVRQLTVRVGRDGRVRPLSSVQGRQRAAEVLAEHPNASLREVAQIAGISPTTVSDVRKRLELGQAPGGTRTVTPRIGIPDHTAGSDPSKDLARPVVRQMTPHQADPAAVLDKLLRDPSLRHKEAGRQLLRLLQQNAMGEREWADLSAAVPAHSGAMVVHLARMYAETWTDFAQELDERFRTLGNPMMSG